MATDCMCAVSESEIVQYCPEHHRYWKQGKELVSVTRMIKDTWPIKPDFERADPAVLENARERGVELDTLFSAYVEGSLREIPAGTRKDVVELFQILIKWWDRLGIKAKSQQIVADDDVAGTCDLLSDDDDIFDLKTTYNIEPIYKIQVGMYALLRRKHRKLGLIHVTKRFPEPKLIELNADQAIRDAFIVREMYQLVRRVAK